MGDPTPDSATCSACGTFTGNAVLGLYGDSAVGDCCPGCAVCITLSSTQPCLVLLGGRCCSCGAFFLRLRRRSARRHEQRSSTMRTISSHRGMLPLLSSGSGVGGTGGGSGAGGGQGGGGGEGGGTGGGGCGAGGQTHGSG